ncbi:MAG TPA: hypothetical protein VKE29_00885 [Candidatus Udaeobacter sp.]|nr:hypothetical protein [Candidatus Udaeobacter sp.]
MRVLCWILLLIVCFAAWIAVLFAGIVWCYFAVPAARAVVAWIVFGTGGIYALWLAVVSWAWGEFIAAGIGRAAAVLLLTRGQKIFRRTNRVASQNA